MSFTNVFGGSVIYPSDVSYLALPLSANTPLEWPLESSGAEDPAARIIDVTPTASGFSVTLPDATLTGAGQTILFNNTSGAFNFLIKDFAGGTLATVGFGEQWQLYLAATTTAAGTWRVFRFGASTASVQPSALAGFGVTVTGSTLSQSLPATSFSTSGLILSASNRAGAFLWTGTGAGTLNLPAAASVGNNYFVLVRNAGGGDLTVDPSGTELINGGSTLTFRPGDSATVITDGATWYTVGLGQEAVFAFDYTQISVTGGTLTLTGAQLNRIAYKFVGTLGADQYIVIPATVQQYWITNATMGAFNLFVKTASGPSTQVQQGAKGIYYCDGTNVILASDPTTLSTPITVAQGGTGATTASAARLNLGISTFADPIVTATTAASVRTTIGAVAAGANTDITSLSGLTTPLSAPQGGTGFASYAVGDLLFASTTTALSKLADVATGNSLISGGIGVAPAWGKIGLTTHVSGTLPVANGGTGATTSTGTGAVVLATSPALVTPNLGTPSAGTLTNATGLPIDGGTINTLPIARGGTNATTAPGARTSLGATTVGGNLFTLTDPSAVTFPRFNADNSVSALDAASFRTAIGAGAGGGSVTSVSFTGGIVSVATPTTTPAFTVAGTSGGIPYFSSGTTWATSAALAANAIVVGGGAGAAPATVTTGTGVVTALGVNVGSAGAFVTFNGALGTPSSGTLTNCTFPTLNQSTTGSAGSVANAVTFNNGGAGAASGTTYNGSAAQTISHNTVGAYPLSGNPSGFTTNTGTVTSVAALTLGTAGTDLSSSVATNTTTPVITLNVPTASAANRGALSAADWSAFNGKAASGNNTDITALDQDVTVTATGTIAANTIGYRGLPQNSQTASYTLALSDAGKHISITTGGVVVPANGSVAFPVGSAISVYNNSASNQTISITTDTMYLAGTATTGSRTLAQRGVATILKVDATTWVISGGGLT